MRVSESETAQFPVGIAKLDLNLAAIEQKLGWGELEKKAAFSDEAKVDSFLFERRQSSRENGDRKERQITPDIAYQ